MSPSAADSAGISLCEVGRKLNGSYFIIKASKLEESGNTVVYRAYSPRTANQYALTLDPAELAAIVGPERMPSLFSESMSDRKAAHQAVIDSLQFEDRMLAQPLVQSPSKYSGTPRLDGDVSDGGSDTAGSPSRAPVGVDPAGFLVLRVGRKLNGKAGCHHACCLQIGVYDAIHSGKYFIITMRQVQHASDPQKNSLHVLLYSPRWGIAMCCVTSLSNWCFPQLFVLFLSTSQRLTGVLTSQEAVQLLEVRL